MTLNDKEKRELQHLQRSLDDFLKRLPKPAKVNRISDAKGDRLHINDNGNINILPIISNQVNSRRGIK